MNCDASLPSGSRGSRSATRLGKLPLKEARHEVLNPLKPESRTSTVEIKVYTIKLDTPPWLRRAIVYLGIPAAAIFGVSALVYADVEMPHSFANGEVLHADAMNENFEALRDGINALEPFPPILHTFSIQENPPSATTVTHPDGASSVTFPEDGLYTITLNAHAAHSNPHTWAGTDWVVGGSAARLDSMASCPSGVGQAAPHSASCVTWFRATAGQTVTLLPRYSVVYDAPNHAFMFEYMVQRVGD